MRKPNEVKRGQAISFRIPSDTPDHLLKHLQQLRETEKRNFSSKIAAFVLQGVGQSQSQEKEVITIPLPHQLTKAQRNWLKHEHSEALLGSIIYQLLTDPARAAALLASLNSNALDLDDALYLQEETDMAQTEEDTAKTALSDDDLDAFTLEDATESLASAEDEEEEQPEEDLDSLLGDFLAEMNK